MDVLPGMEEDIDYIGVDVLPGMEEDVDYIGVDAHDEPEVGQHAMWDEGVAEWHHHALLIHITRVSLVTWNNIFWA